MRSYFDTGVLLKLYTAEPDSAQVEDFVHRRARPLLFTELHHVECTATFRLKQFRGECSATQAVRASALIDADLRTGVLRMTAIDWIEALRACRTLTEKYAATTDCRILDTLHVACALALGAAEFVTSDLRQAALAAKLRLQVTNPTAS